MQNCRHRIIPLAQHLVELSVWVDGLGATLRQEDNELVQWNGHHVLTKLHKFQGMELDLSWTQQDLDHVNQEAIRYSQQTPLFQTGSFGSLRKFRSMHSLGGSSEYRGHVHNLDHEIGVLNEQWQNMRNHVKLNVKVNVRNRF